MGEGGGLIEIFRELFGLDLGLTFLVRRGRRRGQGGGRGGKDL